MVHRSVKENNIYFKNKYIFHDKLFHLPSDCDKVEIHNEEESRVEELYLIDQTLEVTGQGTISFELEAEKKDKNIVIAFSLRNDHKPLNKLLILTIGSVETSFVSQVGNKQRILENTKNESALIDIGRKQSYWFSLDKENNRIRFGKGYMLEALTELKYDFKDKECDWIKELKYIAVSGNIKEKIIENIKEHKQSKIIFWKYAVTEDLPAIVQSQDYITLDDLDNNRATVINNLSIECQILYANVAGSNIQLNTPDFPDFASAINYSIVTKGCLCYEKLLSKASEFGHENLNETYLRVTVGINKDDSPGVPFVLEIWPGGNYSPIHSHSNCNAIIKVLHGSITAQWFSSLNPHETEYYEKTVVCEGQVTWLNDRQFQTHRLFNHNVKGNMCATIQCYMYNDDDNIHYEYFDYLDNDKIKQFTPNSDWGYSDFKRQIRKEWYEYKKNAEIVEIDSKIKSV